MQVFNVMSFLERKYPNEPEYLQAVREVFTDCSNLPDYRVPSQLGLGPYDYEWQNDIP